MGWLSAILGLAGLLGGGSGGNSNVPSNFDRERLINETLGLQMKRMNQQNPLYEAVQRLAMRLMPGAVQQPIQPWGSVSAYGNFTSTPNSPAGPEGTGVPTTPRPGENNPPAPGREDPQPRRNPRDIIMESANGIDPVVMAQLFRR